MLARSFLYVLALAGAGLAGEEVPRGRVVEAVVCGGNKSQSYALYLPAAYSADRAWPILYCLDPGARGGLPVQRFQAAAERAGFIVAGSNNSRNGSLDIPREAIHWLLADTHERFAIDDSRRYVAGFSGGARLALDWAGNGRIAGVIACGAGFGESIPKDVPLRVYATAGVDDFNYDEVYAMSRELGKRGVPQRFAEFAGGHDWLPETLAGEALDFVSGRLKPEPLRPESPEQKKAALSYWHLQREMVSEDEAARQSTIRRLQRDSERPDDGPDRRAARRVLLGAFVDAAQQGSAQMDAKRYSKAVAAWEAAVLARPRDAGAWYALAESRAGNHDKRGALEALERAIANGFAERDRIERDPLFDGLRKEPKYATALSALTR
jgi:poly(3-hydroxybutyrate) depolymerase